MAFLQIAELESVGPPRFQFENLFRKFYFNAAFMTILETLNSSMTKRVFNPDVLLGSDSVYFVIQKTSFYAQNLFVCRKSSVCRI